MNVGELESIPYVNIGVNEDGSVYDIGNPVASAKPVPKPRPGTGNQAGRPPVPARQTSDKKPLDVNSITPTSSIASASPQTTSPPKPKPRPKKPSESDGVENLPAIRNTIEELIKSTKPQEEKFAAACRVMKIQCALNTKYEIVDLKKILQQNKDKDVRKIPQAFAILEKYATNLLKEEAIRHPSWRSVQFASAAFQNKVKFMVGATDILRSLGYTADCYDNNEQIIGVMFPIGSATNASMVLNIAVDLVIAQFEVEAMLMGEHPRSQALHKMEGVPEIYFPHRHKEEPIQTDNLYNSEVNYAFSSPIVKTGNIVQDSPPPVPTKPTNVSSPPAIPRSPSMSDDYRKHLLLGRKKEIPKELPEYINVDVHANVGTEPSMLSNSSLSGSEPSSLEMLMCTECGCSERPNKKFCSECGSPLKAKKPSDKETDSINKEMGSMGIETFEDADEGWNCKYCTFVNSHETNICSMCYKTNGVQVQTKSKPFVEDIIHDIHAGASPVRSLEERQSPLSHAGASPVRSVEEKRSPLAMGLTDAVKAENFTTIVPDHNQISRTQSDGNKVDEAKLREARKFAEAELQQKKWKELQDAEARKQKLIREQNEMRENAQNLVNLLKLSERHGYAAEECILAQKYVNNFNEITLLNWLRNGWLNLIDEVVQHCLACFEKDGDIGPISLKEAKQILLEVDGDKDSVPLLFSERRKTQITKITNLVKGVKKWEIIQALFAAGGDDEKALQILQKKQLKTFHEDIRKNSTSTDFDRLKDENIPIEVRRRMVMVKTGLSWLRSNFVFRLMEDAIDCSVEELMQVVKENDQYSYDECCKFFKHECQTCFTEFSHNRIHVGFHCKCELCWECYGNHVNAVIMGQHIRNLVCPICEKPDLEDETFETHIYYGMIATEIAHLIENKYLKPNIKDVFDSNIFDFHLKKQENFRYCISCKNGFLWENINQPRMQCNLCGARMCFYCNEKWMDQHEGISCDDFAAWKDANDPKKQAMDVNALLQGREIECPSCKARFELAEGGCAHFVCPECRYEFCGGCCKPFKRAQQCNVDVSCKDKGMHSHHPRDCLYHLRDSDVKDLETLLNNHQVQWAKDYPLEMIDKQKVCGVTLQKDTKDGGRQDEPCGSDAPDKMAGLCEKHYKEYMVVLINNNGIDPIELYTIDEMKNELRRNFKAELPRDNGETDEQFKQRLSPHVLKEVPLHARTRRRNAPVVGGQPIGAGAAAAAPVVG